MILIQGCIQKDRESQRLLYQHYYAYAMSISIRYAASRQEAQEILNDGFMKVFNKIHLYDPEKSFKGWLRKILINTAIDHYRANKKFMNHTDIEQLTAQGANSHDQMSYNEIMELVHKLSPVYRMVFCLHAIDGFTHEEISQKLGISIGASKSNLFKARSNLRKMLNRVNNGIYEQHI